MSVLFWPSSTSAAAIVEHPALVLAEPVERFGGVRAEAVLDVVEPRASEGR